MAGTSERRISAAVSCQMGRRRANNEDNFFLNGLWKDLDKADDPVTCSATAREGVYAVCDGMGGQAHGERAAWMGAYGLSLFRDSLLGGGERLDALVDDCIRGINLSIVRQNEKYHFQMGSTLALAVVTGERFRVFNLGDSRIYLYTPGGLTRLSRDHTEAQSLLDMGIVSSRHAPGEKDGALIQYLGIPAEEMLLEPHAASGALAPGDRLLLCSDGLTDMLSEEEIASVLAREASSEELALALTSAADEAGGKDNVTALVVTLEA